MTNEQEPTVFADHEYDPVAETPYEIEHGRITLARLVQKFGDKPEYDEWEYEEAQDELDAEDAYPLDPELSPVMAWRRQIMKDRRVERKTVRVASAALDTFDAGIPKSPAVRGYSDRAVRVALAELVQCGHLIPDDAAGVFRPVITGRWFVEP